MKKFYEITGGVLLFLCLCTLIISFALLRGFPKGDRTESTEIKLVVAVDSTGCISQQGHDNIDSVIFAIEKYQHQIDDKYKYVLEQKETFNDLITIAGMVLAVIASLVGFFGYKSVNSIEDKIKKDAEKIAGDTAEETSKEKFKLYEEKTTEALKNQIDVSIKEAIGKDLAKYKSTTKTQLQAFVKERVKSSEQSVSDIKGVIESSNISMDNLSQKYSKLEERISALESQSGNSNKNRRTL